MRPMLNSPGVHGPVYSQVFKPVRTGSLERKVEHHTTVSVIERSPKLSPLLKNKNWDRNDKSVETKREASSHNVEIQSPGRSRREKDASLRQSKPALQDLHLHPRVPTPPLERTKDNVSITLGSPKGWRKYEESPVVRSPRGPHFQRTEHMIDTSAPMRDENSDTFLFAPIKDNLLNDLMDLKSKHELAEDHGKTSTSLPREQNANASKEKKELFESPFKFTGGQNENPVISTHKTEIILPQSTMESENVSVPFLMKDVRWENQQYVDSGHIKGLKIKPADKPISECILQELKEKECNNKVIVIVRSTELRDPTNEIMTPVKNQTPDTDIASTKTQKEKHQLTSDGKTRLQENGEWSNFTEKTTYSSKEQVKNDDREVLDTAEENKIMQTEESSSENIVTNGYVPVSAEELQGFSTINNETDWTWNNSSESILRNNDTNKVGIASSGLSTNKLVSQSVRETSEQKVCLDDRYNAKLQDKPIHTDLNVLTNAHQNIQIIRETPESPSEKACLDFSENNEESTHRIQVVNVDSEEEEAVDVVDQTPDDMVQTSVIIGQAGDIIDQVGDTTVFVFKEKEPAENTIKHPTEYICIQDMVPEKARDMVQKSGDVTCQVTHVMEEIIHIKHTKSRENICDQADENIVEQTKEENDQQLGYIIRESGNIMVQTKDMIDQATVENSNYNSTSNVTADQIINISGGTRKMSAQNTCDQLTKYAMEQNTEEINQTSEVKMSLLTKQQNAEKALEQSLEEVINQGTDVVDHSQDVTNQYTDLIEFANIKNQAVDAIDHDRDVSNQTVYVIDKANVRSNQTTDIIDQARDVFKQALDIAVKAVAERHQTTDVIDQVGDGFKQTADIAGKAEVESNHTAGATDQDEGVFQQTADIASKDEAERNQTTYVLDKDEVMFKQTADIASKDEAERNQTAYVPDQDKVMFKQAADIASKDEAERNQTAYVPDQDEVIFNQTVDIASKDEAERNPIAYITEQDECMFKQTADIANKDEVEKNQTTYELDSGVAVVKQDLNILVKVEIERNQCASAIDKAGHVFMEAVGVLDIAGDEQYQAADLIDHVEDALKQTSDLADKAGYEINQIADRINQTGVAKNQNAYTIDQNEVAVKQAVDTVDQTGVSVNQATDTIDQVRDVNIQTEDTPQAINVRIQVEDLYGEAGDVRNQVINQPVIDQTGDVIIHVNNSSENTRDKLSIKNLQTNFESISEISTSGLQRHANERNLDIAISDVHSLQPGETQGTTAPDLREPIHSNTENSSSETRSREHLEERVCLDVELLFNDCPVRELNSQGQSEMSSVIGDSETRTNPTVHNYFTELNSMSSTQDKLNFPCTVQNHKISGVGHCFPPNQVIGDVAGKITSGYDVEEERESAEDMHVWVNAVRQLETPEIMKYQRAPRQPRSSPLCMYATLPPIKEDMGSPKNELTGWPSRPLKDNYDPEMSPLQVKSDTEETVQNKLDQSNKKFSWENTEKLSDKTSPLEMMRKHSGDEISRTAAYKALITQNLSQRQSSIIGSLLLSERQDKTAERSEGKTFSRLDSSLLLSSYMKPKKEPLNGNVEDAQTPLKNVPATAEDMPTMATDNSPDTGKSYQHQTTGVNLNQHPDNVVDLAPVQAPRDLPTKTDIQFESQFKAFPDVWRHPGKDHGKVNPRAGKIVLYSETGFRGNRYETSSDLGNTTDWELQQSISVSVIRGGWLMYEKPQFRGRRVMLSECNVELPCPWANRKKTEKDTKDETEKSKSWIGSVRHVVRDFMLPEISLFSEDNGNGRKMKFVGAMPDIRLNGQPIKTVSIIVHSGMWLVYSQPLFEGDPYILERGGYPNMKAWGSQDPNVCSLQPACIGGPTVEKPNEPKLVLFHLPEFQGSSWEVTRDLHSLQGEVNSQGERLTSVGSLQVLGGCWVGYEKEGFRGHQYLLEEGDFKDFSHWGGCTKELGSLRLIRTDFSEPEIMLYERPGCSEGPCLRLSESLTDVEMANYGTSTGSIDVLSGVWVAYENVDFSGEQYILEKGTYHNYPDWGATNGQICSLQPVLQVGGQSLHYYSKIQLFSEPNFRGDCLTSEMERVLLPESFSPQSCRVEGSSWSLYEGEDCIGEQYILSEGDYPTRTAMGCLTSCPIRSVRKVPLYFSVPSISLHGLERFEGKELEFTGEVRSLQGEGYNNHVMSVKVERGIWVLYEHSDFRGRQWLLECTQIPNWLLYSGHQRIGSLCPIRQRRVYFRLRNRSLGLCLCVPEPSEDMKAARVMVSEPQEGSCDLWYYEEGCIKNQLAPQMSLQVIGQSCPGTKVVLWSDARKPVQTWILEDSGYIMNEMFQGLCLDLKGGNGYDSEHVVVWEVTEEKPTQHWDLEVF
ncbi:beta/gamma crystallin domain-containing protein 2 [Discoglossus pictus]